MAFIYANLALRKKFHFYFGLKRRIYLFDFVFFFVSEKADCFPAVYNSNNVENGWYEWWEKNEFFKPVKRGSKQFSVVLPPPNVTGTLHLGHALTVTIQDVLARW